MKKFLRFYLPIIITIGALSFLAFYYLFIKHKVALDCFFYHECKTITPAKKAVIKVNDVELKNAQIFEDGGRFYLISDDYEKNGFALLIIDRLKNDVILPNSNCHDVLFSDKLLLKDCAIGVYYSDKVKMDGFDTQVKISDVGINFVIPNHKIEILFKGE